MDTTDDGRRLRTLGGYDRSEEQYRREQLIAGHTVAWGAHGVSTGGTLSFNRWGEPGPISTATARRLFRHAGVDPDGRQNGSPPARELVAAAEQYNTVTGPDITARLIGYLVVPHRSDDRVALTGLLVQTDTDAATIPPRVQQLVRTGWTPDEQTIDPAYCRVWWD